MRIIDLQGASDTRAAIGLETAPWPCWGAMWSARLGDGMSENRCPGPGAGIGGGEDPIR
jgi:hypothetical protein